MRIFKNTKEAYPEILRDIVKRGIIYNSSSVQGVNTKGNDDFTYSELTLYSFMVEDSSDCLETCKDPEWVKAEFLERVSFKSINPGEAMKLREGLWSTMLKDGRFDYSYSERIREVGFFHIMGNICDNPSSRQNILSIWDKNIDELRIGTNKRVPCSMYYNFRERNGVIDIIYHMRSSDYYEHFKNDIALAHLMLEYIVKLTGMTRGKLFMSIDSLHAYKKDWGTLAIY